MNREVADGTSSKIVFAPRVLPQDALRVADQIATRDSNALLVLRQIAGVVRRSTQTHRLEGCELIVSLKSHWA
jgi:hypothetical protein